MKKIFPVFLALVLAFSNVITVKAENPQFFKFYSFQSVYGCLDNVDNYGRSNADKNLIVQCLYQKDQSFYNDFYNSISSFPSSALDENDLFVGFYYNGSVNIVCCDSNKADFLVYSNGYYSDPQANGQGTKLYFCYKTKSGYSNYIPTCYTFLNNQWANSSFINNSGSGYTYFFESYAPLLFSNAKIVIYDDLPLIGHTPPSGEGRNYAWLYQNELFDYSSVSLNANYTDSSGSSHAPEPDVEIESNANHMYFKGCDIGFCEPYNQNNFSNYGGAYVYIRYQVDDWIVNHISEYSLDIQLLKVVGSNQETFSKSVLLDRDGCVEIPLSDFSRDGTAVPNSGFDVAVVNSIVEDNYYKSYLYCVQGDLANFVSKNSGVDVTSHTYNNPWGSLKDGVLSSIYFYQVTTETYNLMDNQALQAAIAARHTYNPYIFRIQVNLVSGEERSGDVATKFDLVTGDQSDVSTSGFVNPDPFIPDTSDPNFLPSVPGDNSTTPSTIVYTGGTFSGYFNGAIGFDPGYRELKQDLDADPDDNFTQYLAPFENNEVGGFVGDFLDDMPTAMKSIFIGGFGVLTLLGIYRFIRRG